MKIQQPNSTKPGADQSPHQTRGASIIDIEARWHQACWPVLDDIVAIERVKNNAAAETARRELDAAIRARRLSTRATGTGRLRAPDLAPETWLH